MTWELDRSMYANVQPAIEWALHCAKLNDKGGSWLADVIVTQLSDGYGEDEWEEGVSPLWSIFSEDDLARAEVFTDGAIVHDPKVATFDKPDTNQCFAYRAIEWLTAEYLYYNNWPERLTRYLQGAGWSELLPLIAQHAINCASTPNGAWGVYLDKTGHYDVNWLPEADPDAEYDFPRCGAITYMSNGRPRRYTMVGSYPLYYVTKDGGTLSAAAVQENLYECSTSVDPQWEVVQTVINYEDTDLYCDHTNERIESAYAEPEEANPYTEEETMMGMRALHGFDN